MQRETQDVLGLGLRADLRADSRPAWLKVLAILCVVVVFVMSSAQVCHVHSGPAPLKQGQRQGDSTPEDHCPLCVAMHSALPVVMHVTPQPLLALHTLDLLAADAGRIFRWRFELASRPPPSIEALA